ARTERPTEWQARYNDIPRDFRTAEAKFKKPSPTDCLPIEWSEGLSYELEAGDFVEGVLTDGCLAVVYGDSAVGKSFWVINLGLHIAGGRRWYDRAIDQGVVIYVALEGGKLTKNRVRAAREAIDLPADIPFALATCSLDMRTSNADAIKLTNTIRAAMQKYTQQNIPVRMVVIDTMSRALNGGAEDAEDMGLLLKHADLVRHATGTAVLFVAHCGKDAAKGIRGWSGIRAAVDVEIEIAKNDADLPYIATITKERDLTSGARFGYTLKPVELGRSRRDRMVTTCIVEPAGEVKKPTSKTKLTDAHADFRDHVMEIIADQGRAIVPEAGMPTVTGVTRELLRQQLIKRGWFHQGQLSKDGKLRDASYGVENNALRALKRKRIIGFGPGFVWLIPK
ncbi:MAG: AAA family ATPase, partial [Bradyrhizobium sp.]|uniref:AAA family ATPase n=1 Tax=Bradyrhizobium sp. TaxID=376 RepID=UPI001E07A003